MGTDRLTAPSISRPRMAEAVDAVVQAEQLAQHRAERHTDDDAEQILGRDRAGDADHDRDKGQGRDDGLGVGFLDPFPKQDADGAADQHRRHIDKNCEHSDCTFISDK